MRSPPAKAVATYLSLLSTTSSSLSSNRSQAGHSVFGMVAPHRDITTMRCSENDIDPNARRLDGAEWRMELSNGNGDETGPNPVPPSSSPSDSSAMVWGAAAAAALTVATVVVLPPLDSVPSLHTLRRIQRIGENLFAGTLVVAFLQGLVALGQYRTNPAGQLMVPPGLTVGVARSATGETTAGVTSLSSAAATSAAVPVLMGSTRMEVAGGNGNNSTSSTASLTIANQNSLGGARRTGDTVQDTTGGTTVLTPPNVAPNTPAPTTSSSPSPGLYAQTLNTINRWLVLLVPWAGRQFPFLLARNTHLLHLAFIVTLARLFDLPHQWSSLTYGSRARKQVVASNTEDTPGSITRPIERLVVLGDSLAVGLGCVNIFDADRNSSLPFERLENLGNKEDDYHLPASATTTTAQSTGPVFPRVLAETLAKHQERDVYWRSAGVDGGATNDIAEFCLGVVEEEVRQGRSPDLVVVLCGINDLKYYLSSIPFSKGSSMGPRAFRLNLHRLIDSIHQLAPNCTILLPSVPTQMFHKNSPINIFPFNFVMDSVIGFWDSLKMAVAEEANSVHFDDTDGERSNAVGEGRGKVIYLRTNPKEVMQWYEEPNPLQIMESSTLPRPERVIDYLEEGLISADGVHPNAKCYALWAQSLANHLLPSASDTSRHGG